MGGVGGVHLLTLVRLGISKFRIADLDSFEVANFNRQVGAMMSTLDQPKVRCSPGWPRTSIPKWRSRSFPPA